MIIYLFSQKKLFIHCGSQPYLHPRQQADDTAINVVFYLKTRVQDSVI